MKTSRQYAKDIIQQCFTSAGMDESDVTDILYKMLSERHEATWAMAMEEVKDLYSLGKGYSPNKGDSLSPDQALRDELQYNFPCPPLQTTNEE